jgi:hypothetical protein
MKQTNEKVYRCDYCNKAIISKGFMVFHEKWCKLNPSNHHKCFEFCENLVRTSIRSEDEDGYLIPDKYEFTCTAKNIGLYSYKLEKKFQKHPEILKDRIKGLERMPDECDNYEGRNTIIEDFDNK